MAATDMDVKHPIGYRLLLAGGGGGGGTLYTGSCLGGGVCTGSGLGGGDVI